MTLQKFINIYEKILKLVLFIMMVALAVTVLLGVTFRFAGSALVWYDEVAAVQLAWITYYGSAYAALKGSHISVPSIFKAFPLALRKIFFVVSKLVVYGFLILLAYYGYLVLTLITGETLVTLEWVPQPFVQSVIPIASCLFILSETLRIPEDYKNLVLQTTGDEQTGDI